MAKVEFDFLFSQLVDDNGIKYIGDNVKDQVGETVSSGSSATGSTVKANELPDNDTINDSSKFVTHTIEKAVPWQNCLRVALPAEATCRP